MEAIYMTPTQERANRIRAAFEKAVNGWYTVVDRDDTLWSVIRSSDRRSYYVMAAKYNGLGAKDTVAQGVPNLNEAAWIIAECTDIAR